MKISLQMTIGFVLLFLSISSWADKAHLTSTSGQMVKLINQAAESGDAVKMKRFFKDKNIDWNAQDEVGMTPLMSAALNGQVGILKQILGKKVNLEIKNSVGDTALAVAVSNDQFAAAQILLQAGANVDLTLSGEEGDTLLIRAAGNDLKTAEIILRANKSLLNKVNTLGETPLMKSVLFGRNDSVKMLLKQGADRKVKNKAGLSALDIAVNSHNQEAIRLLNEQK